MDDIKGVAAEVGGSLLGRISRGFGFFWLISFASWNHKFFIVVFSDGNFEDKFKYIENIVYARWFDFLGLLFFGPLLTAFVVVLAYPAVERFIGVWWLRWERQRREDALMSAEKELLDREQSLVMRRSVRKANADVKKLGEKCDHLQKRLALSEIVLLKAMGKDYSDKLPNFLIGSRFKSSLGDASGTSSYVFIYRDGLAEGYISNVGGGVVVGWGQDGHGMFLVNSDGVKFNYSFGDYGDLVGPTLQEEVFKGFPFMLRLAGVAELD